MLNFFRKKFPTPGWIINEFLQLTLALWNRTYLKRPAQLDRAISLAVSYSVTGPTLDSLRESRRKLK